MGAVILSFPSNKRVPEFSEAAALEAAGDTVAAAAMYLEILEANDDPRASINLGTMAYNRKHYATAESYYRKAIKADPEYAQAWFNLGNALDELGRHAKALAAYRKALDICPRFADAHFNLAISLQQQGKQGQALKHWQAYVKLDPSGPWADRARNQIMRITLNSTLKCVRAPEDEAPAL